MLYPIELRAPDTAQATNDNLNVQWLASIVRSRGNLVLAEEAVNPACRGKLSRQRQ